MTRWALAPPSSLDKRIRTTIEYIHQTWETTVQVKTVINLLLSKRHKNENWRKCRPQCLSVSPSSRSLTAGSIKVIWQHSRFVNIWHRIQERFTTSILIKRIWAYPWNCFQMRHFGRDEEDVTTV